MLARTWSQWQVAAGLALATVTLHRVLPRQSQHAARAHVARVKLVTLAIGPASSSTRCDYRRVSMRAMTSHPCALGVQIRTRLACQ